MSFIFGVLLIILILYRLYRIIQMLTLTEFWVGILLNVAYWAVVMKLYIRDFSHLVIIGVLWLMLVMSTKTFRLPVIFVLSIISLGLIVFSMSSDSNDADYYSNDNFDYTDGLAGNDSSLYLSGGYHPFVADNPSSFTYSDHSALQYHPEPMMYSSINDTSVFMQPQTHITLSDSLGMPVANINSVGDHYVISDQYNMTTGAIFPDANNGFIIKDELMQTVGRIDSNGTITDQFGMVQGNIKHWGNSTQITDELHRTVMNVDNNTGTISNSLNQTIGRIRKS